jgi:hypothetical protein
MFVTIVFCLHKGTRRLLAIYSVKYVDDLVLLTKEEMVLQNIIDGAT